MNNLKDLKTKLKHLEPEIQTFVSTLESENLKLKRKIGKLEVDNLSLKNDIILLTEENAQCVEHNKDFQSLSSDEIVENMQKRLNVTRAINKKNR
jgi:hypothetical protein